MSFSEKLQKLRKANHLSQEGLADLLDVTRQSVSKWESGQTYPEMDKLLAMCKIFKCTLDDLTNDEITDIKIEEKKKSNIYTLVDSVLDFISRTYQTCRGMNYKELIGCLLTMFIVVIVLLICHFPFQLIEDFMINTLHMFHSYKIINFGSHIIRFILDCCYYCLFILIYIYIFKIVYLDNEKYKNRIKLEKKEIEKIIIDEATPKLKKDQEERKITIVNKSETIFRFLGTVIMFCAKALTCIFCIPILITLFFLCAAFLISIVLLTKGVFFISLLIGIPFTIVFTILILEIFIDFITGRKTNEKRLLITFFASVIGLGFSFGMLVLDISSIRYSNEVPKGAKTEMIERIYDMTDDFLFLFEPDIEYVVDPELENQVKLEVEYYSEYVDIYIPPEMNSSAIGFEKPMIFWELINQMIDDLSSRKIYNYAKLNEFQIKVYTSEKNRDIMKANYEKHRVNEDSKWQMDQENRYYEQMEELENEKNLLQEENNLLKSKIEELEMLVEDYKNKIEDYKERLQSIITE